MGVGSTCAMASFTIAVSAMTSAAISLNVLPARIPQAMAHDAFNHIGRVAAGLGDEPVGECVDVLLLADLDEYEGRCVDPVDDGPQRPWCPLRGSSTETTAADEPCLGRVSGLTSLDAVNSRAFYRISPRLMGVYALVLVCSCHTLARTDSAPASMFSGKGRFLPSTRRLL